MKTKAEVSLAPAYCNNYGPHLLADFFAVLCCLDIGEKSHEYETAGMFARAAVKNIERSLAGA